MKYTIFDNIIVDQKIDEHMNIIVKELINILGSNLYAIILTGGFGRGEGSVLISTEGPIRIINDYDFEIVYKPTFGEMASKIYMKTKYAKALSKLETKLSKKINIKQLDFTLRSLSDYTSNNIPRLADYDTKYGHIILYGNDPTLLMPDFEASNIPAFEGSWLLRNRGIGLLLAYFYLNRDNKPDCQATDNFYIEINKALLAMGDALFIINKRYHHSYQRRLDTVDTLKSISFNRISELIELYKIAATHKLKPGNNTFDDYGTSELWHIVADLYIDLFTYYESKRLNIKFKNIEDYISNMPYKPSLNFKEKLRIFYELCIGNIQQKDIPLASVIRDKNINLGFTLALLTSLHEKKGHEDLLQKIKKLSCLHDNKCDEICKKYLIISHPSGELIRFLNKSNI